MAASEIPEYGHVGLGQAKPSVFTRFGAPRRLFTSRQGRTGADAGSTPDEAVEARRQAGQSSGERGDAADGAAWCAWLLLVRRKAEKGTSQDAKTAPGRGGDRPQAGTRTHEEPYETSLLEMGRKENSLSRKDKTSPQGCQASRREVRII